MCIPILYNKVQILTVGQVMVGASNLNGEQAYRRLIYNRAEFCDMDAK